MEERKLKKIPGKKLDTSRETNDYKQPSSSGAPWWLVFVLVLALLGMGSYIAWMNSAEPENRKSYLSYLFGLKDSETEVLAPIPVEDSLAVWEGTLLNSDQLGTDSVAQDWNSSSSAITNESPEPVFDTSPSLQVPAKESVQQALPEASPVPAEAGYYIKAGEFKSRSSALFRISELRQGNYPAKIIEPASVGENYIVSAGEFTSYSKAKEQAKTIGFILDIRTSVVKKE